MARIVRALAEGLDPERYRIHTWFLEGAGPQVAMLQQAGVRANSLDWWRGMRDPMGAWRFWRRLRNQRLRLSIFTSEEGLSAGSCEQLHKPRSSGICTAGFWSRGASRRSTSPRVAQMQSSPSLRQWQVELSMEWRE